MRPKELSREKETEREIFLHQNKNILFVTTLLRGLNDKQQTERKYLQVIYLTKNLFPEYIINSQNLERKQTIQFLKIIGK